MTQSKTPLTAAAEIRPHLPALLDPETAQAVDAQLQTLLSQVESGKSVENQITETLRQYEPTQAWIKRYLKGENPDQITRSIQLPGNSPAISSSLEYQCQECGKSLKSPQVGIQPKCLDHPKAQVNPVATK